MSDFDTADYGLHAGEESFGGTPAPVSSKELTPAYVEAKDMKLGEKYYFVDTDFSYGKIKAPEVKYETVYRIVGYEYSTKEPDDRYERIRHCAFRTEREAKLRAIEELKDYRRYLNKEVKARIAELEENKS
jgi:hypothetical protein